MGTVASNTQLIEEAGFRLHDQFVLSSSSWTDGFYEELKPRASELLSHSDAETVALAKEMLEEIEVFEQSGGSYGYVFYLLQRNED